MSIFKDILKLGKEFISKPENQDKIISKAKDLAVKDEQTEDGKKIKKSL